MNYKKVYEQIITKAQSENRIKGLDIYYERHHIIPKCLGGDNSKDNLVLLTGKEHYICHKLLVCIYPNNTKLVFALWAFISGFNKSIIIHSAREAALIRISHKAAIQKVHCNKIVSTLTRQKFSDRNLNQQLVKCKWCDKVLDIRNINKWHNDRCKKNPNYTDSHLDKCDHCGIKTSKTNIIRWHNQKCKSIN